MIRTNWKKIVLWILGITFSIALIAGGAIMWFLWYLYGDPYSQYTMIKFDSQVWKEVGADYDREPYVYEIDRKCTRGQMYDDLQKNYLKKGMSKEQVRELLGETSRRRVYKKRGKYKEYIQYSLGICNNATRKFLAIHFNKKSKLDDFLAARRNDDEGFECDGTSWSEEGKCIERMKEYFKNKDQEVGDVT